MKVSLPLLFLLCSAVAAVIAQHQPPSDFTPRTDNTAPIDWKRYRSAGEFSVLLPKFPVRTGLEEVCHQTTGAIYHAYADHAVYEARVVSKRRFPLPAYCIGGTRFSESTFQRRLDELRRTKPVSESEVELLLRKVIEFRWETQAEFASRWLIRDLTNDRWFELSINRRKGADFDEMKYLNSLRFSDTEGIELGDGSPHTLGDAENGSTSSVSNAIASERLAFISKPKARYTDLARTRNTEGGVLLRTTLLPNGSVGNIDVLSGLPNGLTEEAVKAARRLVFLPKRVNGVPVAIVQKLEYTFSIY